LRCPLRKRIIAATRSHKDLLTLKPQPVERNIIGDVARGQETEIGIGAQSGAPHPAALKPRHRKILATLALCVLAPMVLIGAYLFVIAKDQYVSTLGFAVRSEEMSAAQSLLGGLASISGSSTSDTDILYEFIQNQTLVTAIDKDLDLRKIWSRPSFDPVFAYGGSDKIEDLADYWHRMVKVNYTAGTGMILVEVRAFTPEDALAIAKAIEAKSSEMINKLSAIARADEIRYAAEDMDYALNGLRKTRSALTEFRSRMQIVDPQADVQGQMGILTSLQAQLADALISQQMLPQTGQKNDPRAEAIRQRIEVVEKMIAQEREKFGVGNMGAVQSEDYAAVMGQFEALQVDLAYAQQRYLTAQATLDKAQAQAQRQSRYLATYAEPSLPELHRYPNRTTLLFLSGFLLFMVWALGVLVYYSLRDRR
jgi:capsular polysaccharide transport system permease protein